MGQRLALIIGNSEYDDQNLTRLITPTTDVGDLAAVLKSPDIGGFDEVITLINESASTLRRSIARLFAEKSPDDLLLLYFSGHGVKDDRGKLYLAVKDTEHQLLSGTSIPAAFITDEMDGSRSKRQVLILDCCYSGAFERGTKSVIGATVGTAAAFEGSGYGHVVLTATDATQYAWEGDQLGQGDRSVFTHYLIEGLRTGEADTNADGNITLDELYDYTFTRVREATPKQTPSRWAYKAQGDMVIAKNPHPIVKAAKLPVELQESIDDSRPWVREGAVRELARLRQSDNASLALAAREALQKLAEDDSIRVRATADQALKSYASPGIKPAVAQPPSPTLMAEQPVLEAPAQRPIRAIRPVTRQLLSFGLVAAVWGIGWSIGGLIVMFLISLIGSLNSVLFGSSSDGFVVAGRVVGFIGGAITGLILSRTEHLIRNWRHVVTIAIGWTIGWSVGAAVTRRFSDWGLAGILTGSMGAGGMMLWQLIRAHPPHLHLSRARLWAYGRLAIVFLVLLGFFGPWTQISSCNSTEPPKTVTGLQAYSTTVFGDLGPLLLAPILLLFAATLLRTGPTLLRQHSVLIWLERVGAASALISVGVALLLNSGKMLWGFWVTAAGVLLAPLNLVGEWIARRRAMKRAGGMQAAPEPELPWRWLWAMAIFGVLAGILTNSLLPTPSLTPGPVIAPTPTLRAAPTVKPATSTSRIAPTRVAPTQAPTPLPTIPPATPLPTMPPATPLPDYAANLKGEVTLWHYWTGQSEAALLELLSTAQTKYPSLKVYVKSFKQNELRDNYKAALSTGTGLDGILIFGIDLDDWMRSGLTADLTGKLNLEAYSKETIESVTRDGKVWAIPMSAVLVNDVLYYNKKILSSPPQTTADLLKSASQLGFYPDSYLVYEFFSAFGGQLMDANGRCIAEQGGAVDAVQFLLDLKPAGASAYTSLDQLGADFEQGKYGMIIQPAQCIMCGGHSLDTFRKQLGDQLGIAPLPAGPKGPATPLALFEYYVVNPNSKNIDGAIALGQYLTSQESIQMLVDKLQIIPVRTDVKLGDPLLAALTEASVHSVAWPATKEMNNAYVPFNNMLRDVLDGKVSPYDGVKAACYETNKLNGK